MVFTCSECGKENKYLNILAASWIFGFESSRPSLTKMLKFFAVDLFVLIESNFRPRATYRGSRVRGEAWRKGLWG